MTIIKRMKWAIQCGHMHLSVQTLLFCILQESVAAQRGCVALICEQYRDLICTSLEV